MSGTKIGGLKASKTNIRLHGKDFYKRIGQIGGRNGKGPNYTGGFAANPALARIAGAKGGRASRRKLAKDDIEKAEEVLEEESGRA